MECMPPPCLAVALGACACSRRAPVLSAQSAECWPGTVAVPGYCESLPIIMDLQAFRAELAAAKEVRTAV